MFHGVNVIKLAVVLAVELGLYYLKVPVPPMLATLVGTTVAGALPSVLTQFAPVDPGVAK